MNCTQPGLTRKKLSFWYSTLWIKVSSKSSTKVNVVLSVGSSASKKGGCTFGKLVKLLGKTAVLVEAIEDALRMANGFFPVKLV